MTLPKDAKRAETVENAEIKKPLMISDESGESKEVVITTALDNTLTPFHTIKVVFKNGVVMLTSYDYSFMLLAATYQINHLKDKQGDNTLYMASGNLALTIMDACVVVSVTPGIILGFMAKGTYASLMKEKDESLKAKLRASMSSLLKNGLIVTAPCTITSVILMSVVVRPLLLNIGIDPAIVDLILIPLLIASVSLLIYVPRFCIEKILLAADKQIFVTASNLIYFGLFGIGFAYVLGFGEFGFPYLAMSGIFIGNGIGNIFTFLTCSTVLFSKSFKDFHFFRSFLKPFDPQDREQLKSLANMSLPFVLSMGSEWLATTVRNILAGLIDGLAPQNYASQINYLIFLLAMAFGEAAGYQIAAAAGADQHQALYAHAGLIVGGGASLITGGILSIPGVLTETFNGNASPAVVDAGNELLVYAVVNSFFYSLAIIMRSCVLMKTGTWPSVKFNVSIWVGVLTSAGLAFYTDQGVKGINQGALVGTAFAFLSLLKSYIEAFKKKPSGSKGGLNLQKPTQAETKSDIPKGSSSWWCSCFGNCFSRVSRRIYPTRPAPTPSR